MNFVNITTENNQKVRNQMNHYILKRMLQLIPILFAITFLSYGMIRIAGSDVVTQKMENTGTVVSEDVMDAAREQLGLDNPFLTQYFVWLGKLLRGDMGNSYVSGKPVFITFISKLPATLLLTIVSIVLTLIISIPLGVLAAVKQNTIIDYLIRFCSFIGNSLPNFFVSLILMYFLAIKMKWFPVIAKDVSLQSVAMTAITMADKVLVLKDGRKVEYGRAEDVLNHPQDAYTQRLLSAVLVLRRSDHL